MEKIAQQIYNSEENIFLIYAFNATGKTRLSVAYKDLTKEKNGGKHVGVYYNAYSEDLFVWDNDKICINIIKSSLNKYHANLNEDLILEKLALYKPKYKFFLNPLEKDNPEAGFGSVSFFLENDKTETPIKISRGEERIFIWCFFLALFEVEGLADIQNQHFFIDDPVSSLDDNNIFITAYLLLELLKKYSNSRKIIITTHHMGIFSILQDWLKKGENSNFFKKKIWSESGSDKESNNVIVKEKEVNKYLIRFLEFKDGEYKLVGDKHGIHLYHLLLLKMLNDAKNNNELTTYHFVLLRQILECIASFLGSGRFSYVLDIIYPKDDATKIGFKADVINSISHNKIYMQKIALLNEDNKKLLSETLQRLIDYFHFSI